MNNLSEKKMLELLHVSRKNPFTLLMFYVGCLVTMAVFILPLILSLIWGSIFLFGFLISWFVSGFVAHYYFFSLEKMIAKTNPKLAKEAVREEIYYEFNYRKFLNEISDDDGYISTRFVFEDIHQSYYKVIIYSGSGVIELFGRTREGELDNSMRKLSLLREGLQLLEERINNLDREESIGSEGREYILFSHKRFLNMDGVSGNAFVSVQQYFDRIDRVLKNIIKISDCGDVIELFIKDKQSSYSMKSLELLISGIELLEKDIRKKLSEQGVDVPVYVLGEQVPMQVVYSEKYFQ